MTTPPRWKLVRIASEEPNSEIAAWITSWTGKGLNLHLQDVSGIRNCKEKFGAGDEIRTRDINLGKVALYQLSYSRVVETSIFSQMMARCQTLY